jgi:branched-chain amino acid transport system ATP-binding protein
VLRIDGLTTTYGSIIAMRDVSLHVDGGEVVGLIGPNGAGKSTLLNTTVGLVGPASGRVTLEGRDVTGSTPDAMLRLGVALVPERRRLFADLTVEENLLVAGITTSATDRRRRLDEVVALFPLLDRRRSFPAGYLSGGEAQQLAIGRALMSGARLLLMDEPTLGLAPALVDLVFDLIVGLRSQGRTLLVVEQNAGRLLGVADRAYLMRTGSIVAEGTGRDLASRHDLFEVYLGVEA